MKQNRPSTARVTKSSSNFKSAVSKPPAFTKQAPMIAYGSFNDTFSKIVETRRKPSGKSVK